MARIRTDFVRGTLTNALTSGDTTMTAALLASIPEIVSPDIAVIILDPAASAPEIVHITAHTAAATTATIARGRESSAARAHIAGTAWAHGATGDDYPANAFPATAANGDILYGVAASDEYQALAKPATPAGEVLVFATGATAPSWGSVSPFDGIRTQFRANRRLVAEYSASGPPTAGARTFGGTGFLVELEAAGEVATTISGEPIQRWAVAAASTTRGLYPTTSGGSVLAAVSPNHSPRMLMRVQWPAASANLTFINAGFWTTQAATAEGAFLRIVTTGNVFFVTDNGGTETATDLGVLSRTTILGYEIETADAGVTWICRDQAGTVLATHTTNVPTVTTALAYGITGTMAATLPYGVAYARVEATFA